MKIYTKRGDKGQTDLFGGERVSKTHKRVAAYGAVDAANAALGFALSCPDFPAELREPMQSIMSDLFDIGAELACSEKKSAHEKLEKRIDYDFDSQRVAILEKLIDNAWAPLPELKNFVLPTGSMSAAALHMARTAIRKAEIEIVHLVEHDFLVRDTLVEYINRLSDLAFAWARYCNHVAAIDDIIWQPMKSR